MMQWNLKCVLLIATNRLNSWVTCRVIKDIISKIAIAHPIYLTYNISLISLFILQRLPAPGLPQAATLIEVRKENKAVNQPGRSCI